MTHLRKTLFLFCFLAACSTTEEKKSTSPPSAPATEPPPSESSSSTPSPEPTNPLLAYAYQIQPDHKQKDYGIEWDELFPNYAKASGPYDGILYEFFLFRGPKGDYVIRQTQGEGAEDQPYGARFEPFLFRNGTITKLKASQLFPTKKMDALFNREMEKREEQKSFDGWDFYHYVRLPKDNPYVTLHMCDGNPDDTSFAKAKCMAYGRLEWTGDQFQIKPPSAAKCFPQDKVRVWEEHYCLSKSGAASVREQAFRECDRSLSHDRAVPGDRCPRILWLKEKACEKPLAGRSKKDCLANSRYLYNISSEPTVGP